jgi:GNAT superfamily N-acetyltransferase
VKANDAVKRSATGSHAGSSPGVTVRRAVTNDVPALVLFNSAMAKETEGMILNPSTLERGVRAIFAACDKGFYIVAERGERPLGCLLITYEWSDWRNAWWWWIQSVYVVPRARRQGVYAAMHRWIELEARSRAMAREDRVCGLRLYVHRANRRAQGVYRRMGMSPSHYALFEKDLTPVSP